MSMTIQAPESSTSIENTSQQAVSVGDRLQSETTAVRLHIRWLGTRKALRPEQKQQAASAFDADVRSVTASKKLLDTNHPALKAATAVRTQAVEYWKSHTLPYVEPGVRLMRRADVLAFEVYMTTVKGELAAAVRELQEHYGELVDQARQRLGHLFDSTDYVSDLDELFAFEWDYPSCSPPDYLMQVSPRVYESECRRVQERFDEAVRLAEQTFADELSQLVSHLAERLSGQADGKPKIFRDSAVTNLTEFFDRFQRLNIRSDRDLDELVGNARSVIRGVGPQELRDQDAIRQRVAGELARVEASLDQWMIERPRRNILRRSR